MAKRDVGTKTMPNQKKAKAVKGHCWEGGPETADGCSTTCMLEDGHACPHEWTRDDQIRVSFPTITDSTHER